MSERDRADLIRAASYLEANNDEASTMSVKEAERIAATLRRLASARGVTVDRHQTFCTDTPTDESKAKD